MTAAAIAVLAFIGADAAHEVIGHGAAWAALGGRSAVMTTTRLIVDTHRLTVAGGRWLSVGGPLGNLAFAGLAALAQRRMQGLGARGRLFLWLSLAFNLLWAVGYLIYSGVLGIGDWAELVRGVAPDWLWRTLLAVLGVALFLGSERTLARELRWFAGAGEPASARRAWRLVVTSYLASGAVACAAALPDPRGASQVLLSAVPVTFLGGLGLLRTPFFLARLPARPAAAAGPIARSVAWIAAAALAAALFAGLLGPGLPVAW
ncbi:MAG: hypothetical protein JOZ15_14610 [Acidobacteria bacterium]|nr:hypothetical protein [Acidobacteriota bacterium]